MKFNIETHNPNPDYLRELLEKAKLSQRKAAHKMGITERMMRYYLTDPKSEAYRPAPYLVQFALESLAEDNEQN